MNTIIYPMGDAVYVNLTNRCTNDCEFCVRRGYEGVGGFDLRLSREPNGDEVVSALSARPETVVFCGFGEPTMNLEALLDAARFVKSYGGRVRVNTNGHANLIHGRNVVPELARCVDEVSISLNEADKEAYADLTHCAYSEEGFDAMLAFAKQCARAGIGVTLTVVDCIDDARICACGRLAEDLGLPLRVRGYVP